MTSQTIAFCGPRLIAAGPLAETAAAARLALASGALDTLIIFDARTSERIEPDPRAAPADDGTPTPATADPSVDPTLDRARGRGRPKLGVTAREVTLLPRHWDWLARQSGGELALSSRPGEGTTASLWSVALGAAASFGVGAALSFFTGRSWLWSACRQLLIAVAAAGVTYTVGRLVGSG